MEFRLLGPLEVRHDGVAIALGGPRQRMVLAALLLDANTVRAPAQLAESVWETPPTAPEANLRTYVAGLRQSFAEAGVTEARLLTRAGGYLLTVRPGESDLDRFDADRAEGERALAQGDPARADECFDRALARWRGEPLAGLTVGPAVGPELARLAERRLDLIERRAALRVELGRSDGLVGELRELVERYPLRERLWQQLILALSGSGRQAEALRTFQEVREILAEALGTEPGPELRAVHLRLLNPEPTRPTRRGRNDLPGDLADFTGRSAEIDQLLAAPALTDRSVVVVSAIDGMAGVGKTTLAVHLAHRLAEDYPDATLFLDLHGHTRDHAPTTSAAALGTLLGALGLAQDAIPEQPDARAALWRAELAQRSALIVLDNAASTAQVAPLLPGSPGCLVLVTTRHRLDDLPGASTLSLDVLPAAEAAALFARIVGARRAQAEPAAVAEVVRRCGALPLALRIAAAKLRSRPQWTVEHLAQRLTERPRLAELVSGDTSVRAAFELSYRELSEARQRMFRLLGLVPGVDFTVHLAAALAEVDLDTAEDALEGLLDAHLLEQPALGRYRFHDLLREHAAALARDAEPAALDRVFDFYLHATARADRQLDPNKRAIDIGSYPHPDRLPALTGYEQCLAWDEAERPNLVAAIDRMAEHGRPVWPLVYCLTSFFSVRAYTGDWLHAARVAVDAAIGLGDRDQGEALKLLGMVNARIGRYAEAIGYQERALGHYRAVGERVGEAETLNNLGTAHHYRSDYAEALHWYLPALRLSRETGDRRSEGNVLNNLGTLYEDIGRYDEALRYHRESLEFRRAINSPRGVGRALLNIGAMHRHLGDLDAALDHHRQALTLLREVSDRPGESEALEALGIDHRELGQLPDALDQLDRAVRLARECGDPGAQGRGLVELAQTELAADRTESALGHFGDALAIAVELGDRGRQAQAHDGIAAALVTTRPDTARAHLEWAVDVYTELDVPSAARARAQLDELLAHSAS